MIWQTHYLPPKKECWQGRQDSSLAYFFQHIVLVDLTQQSLTKQDKPTFALLGFCCDEGIRRNQGRIGASKGPYALRKVLGQMSIAQNPVCYDVGNITCLNENLENAQLALAEIVALLLQAGITPLLVGGGHEMAFGHYQGIHLFNKPTKLGIVNFDAHFDMRPLLTQQQGSSGTPFLQIANMQADNQQSFCYYCIGIQPNSNISLLFSTAKEKQVQYLTAEDIYLTDKCNTFIDHLLQQHDYIYVSICLDVLASAYAPGVSAPQVLGLTPWQLIPLLRKLAQSGQIISYDIAELSPPYDIDNRTAKLAAHFIQEIFRHHVFTS